MFAKFLESLICSVPHLMEGMFVGSEHIFHVCECECSVHSPFKVEKPKLEHYMVQNQDRPPSPEPAESNGDAPTSKSSEKPSPSEKPSSSDLPLVSGSRVATPQHAPRPKPSSAPLVDAGKASDVASPDIPGADLMKRVVDNLGLLLFSGKVDSIHPDAL